MFRDVTNNMIWWVALVIGTLGIIGHLVTIPVITTYAFWLVVAGFILFLITPVFDETIHV